MTERSVNYVNMHPKILFAFPRCHLPENELFTVVLFCPFLPHLSEVKENV